MIEKYFKIFKLTPEYVNTYMTDHSLINTPEFSPLDECQTYEQCEQVIESLGDVGVKYAIIQIFEKEKS